MTSPVRGACPREAASSPIRRPRQPADVSNDAEGTSTMPVEDNKAVVRRYIELGWSRGDSGVLKECVAPDYHRYQPGLPFPVESENDLEQVIGMYRAGLSDLEVVIDRIVAEGDYVATQVIVRGTHDGELAGVPATGTRVEITTPRRPRQGWRSRRCAMPRRPSQHPTDAVKRFALHASHDLGVDLVEYRDGMAGPGGHLSRWRRVL